MNIFALTTGPFSINTWIVELCENKVLVFDPAACHFTRDSQKIVGFLKEKNLEPIAFLLTHGHFDHITGTGVCKSFYPDIPLVVHVADSVMIGKNAVNAQKIQLVDMGLEKLLPALEELPDPDIVFTEENVLSSIIKTDDFKVKNALFGWKILHTPGHTKGSVCYYNEKEKMLITGDTIFYHSWGRTDFPGGSESEMNESLNRIYSTLPHDVLVYPGHEYSGFSLGENL